MERYFERVPGTANAATAPATRPTTLSAGHGGSQARVTRHAPRPSAHAHGPRHVPRPSFEQDGEDSPIYESMVLPAECGSLDVRRTRLRNPSDFLPTSGSGSDSDSDSDSDGPPARFRVW